MKPILLDCTLRDGAYIVDSMFGEAAIRGIIGKLEDSGAEIIECGWLKNKEHVPGSSFYHVPDDLCRYLSRKKKNVTYTVMIDWDRYDLSFLPPCDGESVDAIRVVFPHGKHREGVTIGKGILKKGYKVFFQAANTLAYSDDDLDALADEVNGSGASALSIVDTFGAMYEEDLERIVARLDHRLSPDVSLGFHSHNNQQLSFALTTHFIRLLSDGARKTVVDASLCGMGRGAGNATTELVVSYLNRKCGRHYDMDAIMDAIDTYMGYFSERYKWGYSTPYFIAGLYCCHVNNIAYLLNNHRTSSRDMRNIIESMDPADRKKYDYDLLEKKYLDTVSRRVDDRDAESKLRAALSGREILLVAPGKSSLTEKKKIDAYIKENDPVVIAVNALLEGYRYDYALFVNPARYDYAKTTAPEKFKELRRIVLSNVKTAADGDELIVAFDHAAKRGWPHFDNAVICALRLLDRIGVRDVAISGFDGFKHVYNESYADPLLPSLNPENGWDALNEEIREMFGEFRKNAVSVKRINMITESYFA
ncbi:MAG: hypothetical protein IJS78_01810 [Clostridia bacterium]|nr:hypothetical protein [Clostridia bacterium]